MHLIHRLCVARVRLLVRWVSGVAWLGLAVALSAAEMQPTRQELRWGREWARDHLLGRAAQKERVWLAEPHDSPEPAGLQVLANHDAVVLNGRGEHPLRVGGTNYVRGLYCHAESRVTVRLPGPGRRFMALAGLDQNDDTARGRGSVVFKVLVRDRVAFESGVLRVDSPASVVDVELGGADQFVLEIGDAGDGIGWDQSDWAEARVILEDGGELWLGDLPLVDQRDEPGMALTRRSTGLPFSFVYGGRPSDECLRGWSRSDVSRPLGSGRVEHVRTWKEGGGGLEVRVVAVEYEDYPVVEWTLFLTNSGPADARILENIQALDVRFQRGDRGEFVLHGNKGDWCVPQSFEPWRRVLGPGARERFAPDGGRPTNGPKGWPYFNLQRPGGGWIVAVGWPGQWSCGFSRDAADGLRVTAAQQWTHLALHPGESIRSPLIALLFWEGTDVVRAQNLWRRWMLAHNVPRLNGQLPPTMTQVQCYRTLEKGGEEDLFETVREFNAAGIGFDLCWRDAGWYPCKGSWPNTGTWEVDALRYPRGFRPFSDWVHGQGKKFIVWFEPERVGDRESWLAQQHPEWLLGGVLLNLGNPEAWRWLVEHTDSLIREQGIDFYRQDFNLDPLGYWRSNDAPDRRGMTENRHVVGYLAFWDELRRRHPELLIDSCASGGRRNDLETLRRAVPLLRSDYQFGREATMPNQGHTFGISSWVPYYGSGCYFTDTYSARSYLMPCTGYAGTNAETRRAYAEARRAAPFMLGDYYPLSEYSLAPAAWMAWQFDRPALGGGMVQAFRRDQAGASTQVLRLRGLDRRARYVLEDLDGGPPREMSGRQLMEEGVRVEIRTQPGAVVILYERAGDHAR